eukprot:g5370.t1
MTDNSKSKKDSKKRSHASTVGVAAAEEDENCATSATVVGDTESASKERVLKKSRVEDNDHHRESISSGSCCVSSSKSEEEEEEEEANVGVQKFKERIEQESLRLIREIFPKKIEMMQSLYMKFQEEQFKYTESTSENFEGIPTNEHIERLYMLLKAEILEMVDMLNHLRLWLRLKVPKAQTGNNFRTEVLAEVLQMLGSGRTSGLGVLEVVAKYFLRRAKYISDAEKFPRAIDQARQVADLDEKQYICLIQGTLGLRNTFMLLHDKFTKNFDRIMEDDGVTAMSVGNMVL